jgi:hypothetical protein
MSRSKTGMPAAEISRPMLPTLHSEHTIGSNPCSGSRRTSSSKGRLGPAEVRSW